MMFMVLRVDRVLRGTNPRFVVGPHSYDTSNSSFSQRCWFRSAPLGQRWDGSLGGPLSDFTWPPSAQTTRSSDARRDNTLWREAREVWAPCSGELRRNYSTPQGTCTHSRRTRLAPRASQSKAGTAYEWSGSCDTIEEEEVRPKVQLLIVSAASVQMRLRATTLRWFLSESGGAGNMRQVNSAHSLWKGLFVLAPTIAEQ